MSKPGKSKLRGRGTQKKYREKIVCCVTQQRTEKHRGVGKKLKKSIGNSEKYGIK